MLSYLGSGGFSTRGVRTGRLYVCARTGVHLSVDAGDAGSLLATRLFARV
jgi:hypothetical protein